MKILYRHFTAKGELLYVGLTSNLLQRTAAHVRREWGKEIHSITLERIHGDKKAQHMERVAITGEKPRFNIRGLEQYRSRVSRQSPTRKFATIAEQTCRDLDRAIEAKSTRKQVFISRQTAITEAVYLWIADQQVNGAKKPQT